jgi:uncharacterized protein (TIGR03086 family)
MDELTTLRTALDQAAGVLDRVDAADLARPTPCSEWDVATLVDHLVAAPGHFTTMMRGGSPEWSATPHIADGWADAFRASSAELLDAWGSVEGDPPASPAWQCAEISVHTWDLATALGVPLDGLDQAPAEAGLAFMTQMLKPEMRQSAFGPEQPAPPGVHAYGRIAAFAGRTAP